MPIRRGVSMEGIKHLSVRQHPKLFYSDIFTPISRGCRKQAVEWCKEIGETRVTISMFHQLDIADQDLLLCILAMARTVVKTLERQKDYLITAQHSSGEQKQLLTQLDATFGNDDKDGAKLKPSSRSEFSIDNLPALVLKTNAYQLLADLNRPTNSGSSYLWLQKSLKRLSKTSFELEDDRYLYGGSNLLSYMINKDTKEITITLNALSAHSIWADNGDYIYSDRRERHALKSDLAKSLHDKLCARVRGGEKDRPFYTDTLMKAVYNDEKPVDRRAISKRRAAFKSAADEISMLDKWTIKVTGTGAKQCLYVTRKGGKPRKK